MFGIFLLQVGMYLLFLFPQSPFLPVFWRRFGSVVLKHVQTL